MKCREIEPLLLAERDGVLTSEQHAVLAEHVAACPDCRRERILYGEAIAFLKTDAANVAMPDIDEEWRTLRRQLRGSVAQSPKKPRLAPVIWFGAPLAAAAALAVAFLATDPAPPSALPAPAPTQAALAAPVAATIAYVDKDSGWLVVWAPESDPTSRG